MSLTRRGLLRLVPAVAVGGVVVSEPETVPSIVRNPKLERMAAWQMVEEVRNWLGNEVEDVVAVPLGAENWAVSAMALEWTPQGPGLRQWTEHILPGDSPGAITRRIRQGLKL